MTISVILKEISKEMDRGTPCHAHTHTHTDSCVELIGLLQKEVIAAKDCGRYIIYQWEILFFVSITKPFSKLVTTG